MEPDVLRTRDGLQLSFVLPHHLNDACIYPRKPSNGSTVIVYAHDGGLRVVWYGGRKLKQKLSPKVNGNSIDLTDDDEEQAGPEYEEEEEEIDSARPFPTVITYTDINLETAVTKIAILPLSTDSGSEPHAILNTHAVFLTACADLSLRLFTVSLEPTTKQTFEGQHIVIDGTNSHQDLISSVAITITPTSLDADDSRKGRSSSRSRGVEVHETQYGIEDIKTWSFLLASTSSTGTGLLLIHQIPLAEDGLLSDSAEDLVPVQRRFLRYPLGRSIIDFNPSLFPSRRHSNLLIASPDGPGAKIYQVTSHTSLVKKRRGSAATTDSTVSTTQSMKKHLDDKVLIDLLVPFRSTKEQDGIPSRKRLLDAKWILHGRAVLVLLDDGEWGIWDLEAAGPVPSTSTGNLVKGQTSLSGVHGGSLTKFAIKGNLGSGAGTQKSTSSSTKKVPDSALAPMTPHTRKTRSQGFFRTQVQATVSEAVQPVRSSTGRLAVLVQSSGGTASRTQDESVIFGYGPNNTLIPSIQSYWRSESGSRGSFDASASARPVILPQLQVSGEEQQKTALFPRNTDSSGSEVSALPRPTQDFLIVTSSRLIIFATPLVEPTAQTQATTLPMRLLPELSTNQDQLLLNSGELDVDGMDRILDSMAHSGPLPTSNKPLLGDAGRKSVGFQLNDHNDEEQMEIDTSTTTNGTRSKLWVNRTSAEQGGRRRLFA